jgi:hypothetical protein
LIIGWRELGKPLSSLRCSECETHSCSLDYSLMNYRSTIWTDLSNEILQGFRPSDSSVGSVLDSNSRSEVVDSLTLSFTFDSGSESLTKLHPSTVQIFRLWQKFLDNVNPLIKIIHVPTVQRELLEASVNLEEVSKPFEALMFAIYASAITSISDEECMKLTSTPKGQLRQNYHRAAQQALTRAGFLGTLDVVVLQAALLLLVCGNFIFIIAFPFIITCMI